MSKNSADPLWLDQLRDFAINFGPKFYTLDVEEFVRTMTEDDRDTLANAAKLISEIENNHEVTEWVEWCEIHRYEISNKKYNLALGLGCGVALLRAIGLLPPAVAIPVTYDWSQLPRDLSYLIEPAERFGIAVSEQQKLDLLSHEDSYHEICECASAIRVRSDLPRIMEWSKQHFGEAAGNAVDHLIGIFDLGGILEVP